MTRFATILADPPWHFETYGDESDRAPEYPTMSLDEIAALPVADLAADDAVLFMWVVDPLIERAFPIIRAWGFTPKTVGFYWVKTNGPAFRLHVGLGYWTRANPEICLLATRGKPKRLARDVQRLIVAPVGEHSAKPDEQYARIERLVGGPYLELFARHARPGWSQWGNQVGARGGTPNPVDLPGLPAAVATPPQQGLF